MKNSWSHILTKAKFVQLWLSTVNYGVSNRFSILKNVLVMNCVVQNIGTKLSL